MQATTTNLLERANAIAYTFQETPELSNKKSLIKVMQLLAKAALDLPEAETLKPALDRPAKYMWSRLYTQLQDLEIDEQELANKVWTAKQTAMMLFGKY